MKYLKLSFWLLTGTVKRFQKNLAVGQECSYINAMHDFSTGTVVDIEDGQAYVKTHGRFGYSLLEQWIDITDLYPPL